MRTKNLFATLLLAAPLAALGSSPIDDVAFQTSPFEVCKDATMISTKDFKKNEEFWKQAIGECAIDVQVLPDTGFFNTMVGKLGGAYHSKRAVDFLEKVGDRTAKYVELNNDITEQLRRCALKDKAWFEGMAAEAGSKEERAFYNFESCEDSLDKVRKSFKEIGPELRTLISISNATGSKWDSLKAGVKYLTGSNMPLEKMALTASEKAEADKIMAKEEAEVQKKFAEAVKRNKEKLQENRERAKTDPRVNEKEGVDSWFIGWNTETRGGENPSAKTARPYIDMATLPIKNEQLAKHRDKINELLGKLPVSAYLSSEKPTDAELAAAFQKVLDNGKGTKKEIAEILAAGKKSNLSDNDRAKKMLELMKYGAVVKEVLAENPAGSCSVATGIANSIANTELRNNVALMTGMLGSMGAAALLGPVALGGTALTAAGASTVAATGVGLAFSAGIYNHDIENFAQARRRAFSVTETVDRGKALGDMKDFQEARDQLVMSAALSPADLLGTGTFFKAAAMGAGSLSVAKLIAKPLQRSALKKALKSKGMADEAIEGLFKQAQSSDPQVAAAAAKQLILETGADPTKVKFVRAAASKGLFLEQNPEAMKEVLKEVKNGQVYTRALDIMDNMNAAKINAGNRDQALKAAIAGAEFGVTDPKRLAAIITDWDEGLDGLTKTYEIAAKKLNEPKIRGLASVEERQNAAFASALDDLRASNPELKAMPEKQWAEMKDNMMTCPLKPGK